MDRKIRKPTQKRSLEKFNKIVDAAFKLFNEKGYFNTTTVDIAKEAGVATGSVYSYFEDKKDIYIQVLEKIQLQFNFPSKDFWMGINKDSLAEYSFFKIIFSNFLKLMLSCHNFSKAFHDDMEALSRLDESIKKAHDKNEARRIKLTYEIFDILAIPFKSDTYAEMFLHFSNLLIDDVCHKVLYDTSSDNLNAYIESCTEMLFALYKKCID